MKHISLRELCGLVERTTGKKLPTARALRESGTPVVARAMIGLSGEIAVYKNGFYTYSAEGGTTVYAVDRCAGYAYDGGEALNAEFFNEQAWTLRLMLAGEDRLERNHNTREESNHFSYSGDIVEREDLRDPHDFTQAFESMDTVERLLSMLTDRQRHVVEMYFIHGLTQQQIASRIGIKQQSVADTIRLAQKKLHESV